MNGSRPAAARPMPRTRRGRALLGTALGLALSTGLVAPGTAQSLPTSEAASLTLSGSVGDTPPAYRFVRGDELSLKFFYTPELNTTTVIRPDGRISIPLVGDLLVDGMSGEELERAIVAVLATKVRRPEVSINVQTTPSQRVFVGGEVLRPGVQPLGARLSLVQAVMAAEGLKETARGGAVVLIRRGPQGEREVRELDLQAALDGRDLSQDVALRPSDVIVVPRSGVANLNLWVDQYIRRNLPFSVGYSYNVGGGALK